MSELTGLRGRLAVALVAVSALTLGLTSLLLLSPLDRKLREDALRSVAATARAARPGLTRVHVRELKPGRKTAVALRRRTGLDVALFDAQGRLLIATDRDTLGGYPEVRRALARKTLVARLGRGDGEAQAQVALPVKTATGGTFAVSFRKSLNDLSGASGVVRRSLVAAAIVALGFALVVGIALASRLARRLTALRDVALAVAAEGPGAPVVDDDGARDEVGDLRRAFATMQRRLEEQERARRAFVANASHELRTPLTSLRLMLHGAQEDLAEAEPDLPDARDQVERALGQTVRLGQLAEDLLDLSRIDAGVDLRVEPVELGGVVRSVLTEFPADAVVLEVDDGAWASADPGAVARIARILLDNALRHGQHVRVAVAAGATLTVADDGPGVAADRVDRVFERFERGEGGGFGLGLAIARELARGMGGDVFLRGPGPGATFELRLPPHDAA